MDAWSIFWWASAAVLVIVTAVVAVRLAVKLVRARRLLGATNIPMSNKVLFWAAIAYLICPVDLLPDPVLLDDIGFLLVALRSLQKAAVRAGTLAPGRREV